MEGRKNAPSYSTPQSRNLIYLGQSKIHVQYPSTLDVPERMHPHAVAGEAQAMSSSMKGHAESYVCIYEMKETSTC